MSYNKAIIQGNIVRDVETKSIAGTTVAVFSVATSEKYKRKDGTLADNTEYHEIEWWNPNGIIPYLTKGTSVLIEGTIRTERWTSPDGQQREKKKIRATFVGLCGSARQSEQQNAPAPAPAPAPQAPAYPQPPVAPPRPQYPTAPTPPAPPTPQGGNNGYQDLPFN